MPISDQTLHVKSFFAPSIPEAIEMARLEMGPNALLIQTREAPPEARHLGAFEVVLGCGPQPDEANCVLPAAPGRTEDIGDLCQRLDQMQNLLNRIATVSGTPRFHEGAVERALVAADVDPDLAHDLEEAARQRSAKRSVREIGMPRSLSDLDRSTLADDLVAEVESRIEVDSELGRITALVGPPGSGKTTTLVKLAISRGIAAGRRVRLISADSQRIGGAEQLRTFASILGVGFQAVETTSELEQAIHTAPADAMILIDTPGYSARMLREVGCGLAQFLASRQDIDIHLVLTASTRPSSLRLLADGYGAARPGKLLFTRMDEATSYAPAYCEAVRQGLPLSFFTHGQDIPDDLAAAVKSDVSASLVRQLPQFLHAVA